MDSQTARAHGAPAVAGRDPNACDSALAQAFRFLGKRWNGVLLATLVQRPAGFAELKRAVQGISDSVLSDRLSELVEAGLIGRAVDQGPPLAVTYSVTDAGRALVPALDALTAWAQENLPAGSPPHSAR